MARNQSKMMMSRRRNKNSLLMSVIVIATMKVAVASTAARSVVASTPSIIQATLSHHPKRLNIDTISSNLKRMEYAVRGKIAIEADKIADELVTSSNKKQYPFDHIVYTNIGNPHAVDQKPLTWPRQVLALLQLPDDLGVNHPEADKLFPQDAIDRAREMKSAMSNRGMGAYTHSKGVREFRKDVARFIEKRDGAVKDSVDVENIYLTSGASEAITMIMTGLIKDSSCGVMIPIPQYPLYSATLDLLGGHKIGYYLDEQSIWGMNVQELERSLAEAKANGVNVVALVLINPGNPTGQVLSGKEVKDIVSFCAKHDIVLLSDEVYQENVYREEDQFFSSRRAADELGLIENDAIQLCSFHSVSKGVFGECGQRGGYVEMVGIPEDVNDIFFKMASSKLCSNASGQAMVSLMCRGPKRGDVSYESHEREKVALFDSLKERASVVSQGLDNIPGFACQPATGAMYAFPSVQMPSGAIKAAQEMDMSPDTLYALELLQTTGICVVPASGFGQKAGRFGFRTTFLSPEMESVVEDIKQHYEEFCNKYA